MSEDMAHETVDDASTADSDSSGTRRSPSSRLPAVAVALVTLAAAAGLALVAQHVSDRQERTLLKERTNEVTTLLSTAVNDARTTLNGAAAAAGGGQTALFTTLVAGSTANGGEAVAVQQRDGAFTVVDRAGAGAAVVGSPVPAEIAPVATRALA